MALDAEKLVAEIRTLPDEEKLRLLDAILMDVDKPAPEIDRIWANEARQHWAAYRMDAFAPSHTKSRWLSTTADEHPVPQTGANGS